MYVCIKKISEEKKNPKKKKSENGDKWSGMVIILGILRKEKKNNRWSGMVIILGILEKRLVS